MSCVQGLHRRGKPESQMEGWCYVFRLLCPKNVEFLYLLSCWFTCLLVEWTKRVSDDWLVFSHSHGNIQKGHFYWRNMNNDPCFVTNAIIFVTCKWAEPQIFHILISLFNSQTAIPCYNLSHSIKTATAIILCSSWMRLFRLWVEKSAK